jgi:hypothetical protein
VEVGAAQPVVQIAPPSRSKTELSLKQGLVVADKANYRSNGCSGPSRRGDPSSNGSANAVGGEERRVGLDCTFE